MYTIQIVACCENAPEVQEGLAKTASSVSPSDMGALQKVPQQERDALGGAVWVSVGCERPESARFASAWLAVCQSCFHSGID